MAPAAPTVGASPVLVASIEERLRAVRGGAEPTPALLEVVVDRFPLPGGPPLQLCRPSDWGSLRDAEKAQGRPTPYWAVSWASGRALARALAGEELEGRTVLDLGSGLGLAAVAAARAGARVTALDASADAVVFAAHNLALNDLQGEVTVGDFKAGVELAGEERFDLVLGADVLYTRQNVELLLDLLPRLVADGGEAWIADPGRTGWDEFKAPGKRRWHITSTLDRKHPQAWVHRLARRP